MLICSYTPAYTTHPIREQGAVRVSISSLRAREFMVPKYVCPLTNGPKIVVLFTDRWRNILWQKWPILYYLLTEKDNTYSLPTERQKCYCLLIGYPHASTPSSHLVTIPSQHITPSFQWGGRGKGVLHQIFGTQVQHANKIWTQSDLRFCKNEWSKRFKINEKRGQLDWKLRETWYKMLIIC